MGGCQKVTLVINEEGVAEEGVVVAARGGGLVKLINNGTDSGGERGVALKVLGSGAKRQAAKVTDKKSYNPGSATPVVLQHSSQEPFQGLSGTRNRKVAAWRRSEEGQKKDRYMGVYRDGINSIFCNNRNNRYT